MRALFYTLAIFSYFSHSQNFEAKKATAISKLSGLQKKVTQDDGTETPFKNKYWDNKKEGIYVDIVLGQALFSSTDKYKSGTGWPSFTKPIDSKSVVEKKDISIWGTRTEIRSKVANSHLGHVFNDGPKPTKLRYCINSAALEFIPVSKLKDRGYAKYLKLFDKKKRAINSTVSKAIFAGGCFWCMEKPFEKLKGVKSVISGYIGGSELNPTYDQVSAGITGHTEAVEITYDSNLVTYNKLLDVFWRQIDPTQVNGQFVDKGKQYRTGIFYMNDSEKELALKSKSKLQKSGVFKKPIVTEVTLATKFYPAEDYHQDYYKKNPIRYKYYRYRSGRDKFLDKTWK